MTWSVVPMGGAVTEKWRRRKGQPYRLAVLTSHPIQYFAPLYRRLAQEPDIELVAYYCSRQGLDRYHDAGFGESVEWDIPLLDGYASRFLPNWRSGRVAGFASLINPSIMAELVRERYDAIWIHGHNYLTNLLAIAAARLTHTAVMFRCETHLLLERSSLKRRIRPVVLRVLYGMGSAFLAIGTRNAQFYRRHGVEEDRIFLVPYAVDNDYFVRAVSQAGDDRGRVRAELGVIDAVPLILYASKLQARKRPMDLLLAYEQLRRAGQRAALLYVGSGEERERLERRVASSNIPDVHFAGFQNQRALPRYYAAADLFVLPSENEPWGLVVNEAMCAGLPVVCSSEIGAAADLVQPGINGLLYEAGDIAALTRCLATITQDAELRARMGCASSERIAEWSYEQCVQGVRAALQAVTSSRTR